MSYKDKLYNYQYDCIVKIGKYPKFSDYISNFSKNVLGKGVDIGAGPGGHNGRFFSHCEQLDGCDADIEVVNTLPNVYYNKYDYLLGYEQLPYNKSELDFVICSCVIQHLNNFEELERGIKEISRVLKTDGEFYLMFKVGSNDTKLTHFNSYYKEERTFRVFNSINIIDICKSNNLILLEEEKLVDDNWIPYCCLIFTKK